MGNPGSAIANNKHNVNQGMAISMRLQQLCTKAQNVKKGMNELNGEDGFTDVQHIVQHI